jgi:diguanylate cyclase (GGDEF)-like protein
MSYKTKKLTLALSHIRTSSHIIALLSVILTGVLSGGYLVVEKLSTLRKDAYAINNLGVIRGSIQLISKRELNQVESDQQIEKVDNIFIDIRQSYLSNESNLPLIEQYQIDSLEATLEQTWIELKGFYLEHRATNSRSTEIMNKSEKCWELADELVFRVQKLSESKLTGYRNLIIQILSAISIFVVIIIIIVYRVIHRVLEQDAIRDSMTGLYNRKYFNMILAEQISLFERYGSKFTLSLIDIDHFKEINDEFGHPHGDKALNLAAKLLEENSRDVDYVFRLGGEEFAVILPQTDLEETRQHAEKYRKLISETDFEIGRSMTVSLGIALYDEKSSAEGVYRNADTALYEAKHSGRNRVISYSH